MKFTFIQSDDKEEIVVYGKHKNDLIKAIENMCIQENNIVGFYREKISTLNPVSIECFIAENDKVYALCNKEKYLVKKRLYELYEMVSDSFVYINKGCIVNINKISHFDVSFGGSLLVVLKSGYKEFVSRRRLKDVKERMNLK
jgi:DNA-binding LytR/AlgR family response regulator